MEVDIFIPCFIDQMFPETGFNMIKLLEHCGCVVHYNPEQTCCGQPAFNGGHTSETRKLAYKFLKDFPGNRIIVSPGGSCTGFVKNYYASLFETKEDVQQATELGARMYDITDFLVNVMKHVDFGAVFPHKVTVHDACSALREYGLTHEPRTLLSHVQGLEIVEIAHNDTCCGFGGTFSMKHTAISTAMVEQKVQNAIETGAAYITSTEASCLMNIGAYIKKQNLPIIPLHIVDILAYNL
ncbi:MAG: (Fe-S)-binding protein [Bacteroidales bacterium]|nr:(Fe-S)-binding protein [Bacteroidales bacterium]NLK81650.1 (Fe-S)-binding protein [Bacteroidales bacterium]